MDFIPHVVRKQAGGVPDHNVRLRHPHGVHQLPQQRQDQFGGIINGVEIAGRLVIAGVTTGPMRVAAGKVYFDGDLLARLISHIPPALPRVEIAEDRVPRRTVRGFTGHPADGQREHLLDFRLVGVSAGFPIQAVPGGGSRIMHPDHPSGMNPDPLPKNSVRCGRLRQTLRQRYLGKRIGRTDNRKQQQQHGQRRPRTTIFPGLAIRTVRPRHRDHPQNKCARHGRGQPLAGIGGPPRFWNDPYQEPDQGDQPHYRKQPFQQARARSRVKHPAGLWTHFRSGKILHKFTNAQRFHHSPVTSKLDRLLTAGGMAPSRQLFAPRTHAHPISEV